MSNLVDKRCISTEWYTPPEILEPVRKLFWGRISCDPCTSYTNPTIADRIGYLDGEYPKDGLKMSWEDNTFVNPPYGKELYLWIEKTVCEAKKGYKIVLLVSASSRWDQKKWQRIYSPELTTFVMPIGRVKFLDSQGVRHKSPPYPSVLYFYNIESMDVYDCFHTVGTVVQQRTL